MADLHGLARAIFRTLLALLALGCASVGWAACSNTWTHLDTYGGVNCTGNPTHSTRLFTGSTPENVVSQIVAHSNFCIGSGAGAYTSLGCAWWAPEAATAACQIRYTSQTGVITNAARTPGRDCTDLICPPKAGMSAGRLSHDTSIAQTSSPPGLSTLRYACIPTSGGGTTGCTAVTDPDIAFVDYPWNSVVMTGSKTWYVMGPSKYNGESCSMDVMGTGTGGTQTLPEGLTDKPVEPTQCPAGKVPGQVQGMTICVTPGTDAPVVTESKDEKKVTNPDGSTTTTTTTTTTTCTGAGSCTTSTNVTVTNAPSGGGAGTTTSSVTAGTCTSSVGCGMGDESAFGGTCDAGFTCKGDAAMCATAQAINKLKCKLIDAESTEKTLYEGIKAGSVSSGFGTETVAISSGSFSTADLIGGAAGMTDRIVTIGGTGWSKTVTLPFSNVNPYLQQFGTLLVAVAFLVAMGIVFKRST